MRIAFESLPSEYVLTGAVVVGSVTTKSSLPMYPLASEKVTA